MVNDNGEKRNGLLGVKNLNGGSVIWFKSNTGGMPFSILCNRGLFNKIDLEAYRKLRCGLGLLEVWHFYKVKLYVNLLCIIWYNLCHQIDIEEEKFKHAVAYLFVASLVCYNNVGNAW